MVSEFSTVASEMVVDEEVSLELVNDFPSDPARTSLVILISHDARITIKAVINVLMKTDKLVPPAADGFMSSVGILLESLRNDPPPYVKTRGYNLEREDLAGDCRQLGELFTGLAAKDAIGHAGQFSVGQWILKRDFDSAQRASVLLDGTDSRLDLAGGVNLTR